MCKQVKTKEKMTAELQLLIDATNAYKKAFDRFNKETKEAISVDIDIWAKPKILVNSLDSFDVIITKTESPTTHADKTWRTAEICGCAVFDIVSNK